MSRRPDWPSLTYINFAASNRLSWCCEASKPQSKINSNFDGGFRAAASLFFASSRDRGCISALAADADNGKHLAETRCVTCHIISPSERRVVTDAPPFEAIARKYASNPDTLAFSIIDPHPRMNVTLTRREAQDVAAYINTLAK